MIGDIATALGLLLTIWVLLVARRARRAADEARTAVRQGNLADELENASRKIQQVGIFVMSQEWNTVRYVTDDVLAACQIARARLGHLLPPASQNKLLNTMEIVRSIAQQSSAEDVSEARRRRISAAQLRASQLINEILGDARRIQDEREA